MKRLINFITLMFSALFSISSFAESKLCEPNTTFFFANNKAHTKSVELCYGQKGVKYIFGPESAPEIALEVPRDKIIYEYENGCESITIPNGKMDYYIYQCGIAPQTDPTLQVNQHGNPVATIQLDGKDGKYLNAIADAGFE
ncbi:hypothetical protein [Klebsiella michiganensis]|uniref:hypothetical protein n=1 Tax=Klebsiella michiganensis TaxID=1134687 RepID=UPI000A2E6517|nr:hypothetical protein [Klebsiella michiganensis]OSY95231.1 hypothetical protein BM280_06730 [Klebsiella michiganensis]